MSNLLLCKCFSYRRGRILPTPLTFERAFLKNCCNGESMLPTNIVQQFLNAILWLFLGQYINKCLFSYGFNLALGYLHLYVFFLLRSSSLARRYTLSCTWVKRWILHRLVVNYSLLVGVMSCVLCACPLLVNKSLIIKLFWRDANHMVGASIVNSTTMILAHV